MIMVLSEATFNHLFLESLFLVIEGAALGKSLRVESVIAFGDETRSWAHVCLEALCNRKPLARQDRACA